MMKQYKLFAWPYNYATKRACVFSKSPLEIESTSPLGAMKFAKESLYLHDAVVWKLYESGDELNPVRSWNGKLP